MCLDGDASAVYSEQVRRSRKPRVCEECGGPVPVGADYVYVSCMHERGDTWSHGVQHVECLALWLFIQSEVCGGVGLRYVGGLREECEEYSEGEYTETDDNGDALPGQVTLIDILDAIRDGYERMAKEVA